jgi:sec-independent protein translocase protein TatB
MFDIGWSELLVVAVVAIVVVGPRELPEMLRNLGRGMRAVRRMAGDFQGQFNEALREAELDGVRDDFNKLRASARLPDLGSLARDEIRSAIEPPPTAPKAGPALPESLPEPDLPVSQLPDFPPPVIDIEPSPEPAPAAPAPAPKKAAKPRVRIKPTAEGEVAPAKTARAPRAKKPKADDPS